MWHWWSGNHGQWWWRWRRWRSNNIWRLCCLLGRARKYERNSTHFHRPGMCLNRRWRWCLRGNRRRCHGRRWRSGNRNWRLRRHRLTNRHGYNRWRWSWPGLFRRDLQGWNGRRSGRCLRSSTGLSVAPAFQDFNLPRKRSDFVVEFGGLSSATVVGGQGNNNGWRAHHHPSKQEQQYVFHRLARQVMGNLRCILERFCRKVLR